MRLNLGTFVAAAVAASLVAGGCGTAASSNHPAAAAARVYVPQFNGFRAGTTDIAVGKVSYRPRSVLVSEGTDGGRDEYSITRWVAYGGAVARAHATQTVNTCTPACADGHFVTASVSLTFHSQIRCRGVLAYATISVERNAAARRALTFFPSRWRENLAPLCNAEGPADARAPYYPLPLANRETPVLANAAALGVLVGVDPEARVAEFRITCGWYYAPKRRVRPGLWRVRLARLSFSWESYPHGPASGIAHEESRAAWVRQTEVEAWSGSLALRGGSGSLSDGPTTDICAGVLG